MAVTGNVGLVAVHVAIADSHDGGIALDGEVEFVGGSGDAAALAVDGLDAEVHQVGAVSGPFGVFRCDAEADGAVGRFYLVAGDGPAGIVGDGL